MIVGSKLQCVELRFSYVEWQLKEIRPYNGNNACPIIREDNSNLMKIIYEF